MADARVQAEIANFSAVEGDPPETAPAVGAIYEDTVLNRGEWCTVLHVGSDAAIVQRRNGVGRYPLWDFREGGRFRFIDGADSEVE